MIEKETAQKTNIQLALRVYGKCVLCMVMCLFIYISVTAICTGVFTETVGERVYYTDSNQQYIRDEAGNAVFRDVYADGSQGVTKEEAQALADDNGWTVAAVSLRSEMSAGAAAGMNVVLQVLMAVALIALIYSSIWSLGDRDANLVAYHHRQADPLRGLKIGLLAVIPSAVLYVLLVALSLAKPTLSDDYFTLYAWANAPLMPLLNTFKTAQGGLRLALSIIPLLPVPLITLTAYALGYRQISLSEKLIYKNGKPASRRK